MLGKKPPQASEKPVDTIDTLIGQKAELIGDLHFTGGIRVDGKVRGNIHATDQGGSTLVLSELGEIEGNVTVPHVIVNGTIKGNLVATGRVELQAKARITGDVQYKAIEMRLGSAVNGNLVCEPGKSDAPSKLKSVSSDDKLRAGAATRAGLER